MFLVRFRPDNFTDIARTPWAGERITGTIKSRLCGGGSTHPKVGESWEFSTSPEMPSMCGDMPFRELLGRIPDRALSAAHRQIWGDDSPLLIKYVDAGDTLSLQLHPPVDFAPKITGVCGKWEAWHVIDSAPGSTIYLGLAEGVSVETLAGTISSGGDVRPLLHGIEVSAGDAFTIPPSTIHALGAGVCVLEPQIVRPESRPVSMRLHDWNRLYDEQGRPDPNGRPRALHLDEALKYLDNDAPRGRALERALRIAPDDVRQDGGVSIEHTSPIPCVKMVQLRGSGRFVPKHTAGELAAIIVEAGTVDIKRGGEGMELAAGDTGALMADSWDNIEMNLCDASVFIAWCVPKYHEAVGL